MGLPFRFDLVQVKNSTRQEEFILQSALTVIAVNANLHEYDKHLTYKLMQFQSRFGRIKD